MTGITESFRFVLYNYELLSVVKNEENSITHFDSSTYCVLVSSEAVARDNFGVTGICSTDEEWLHFEQLLSSAKGEIYVEEEEEV